MKLIEFVDRFPSEETCKQAFKAHRELNTVICRRCSHDQHYWLKTRDQYKCKKCSSTQTLRSGTLLEQTKLPYRYWFIAMHLITSTKKGFSALELQRQLGHKRYQPIWYMMHKIRSIMGQRDDQYQLEGNVEADEAFFEIAFPVELPTKRGRGSEAKQAVLVMASTEEVKHKKKTKNGKDRYSTSKRCKFFKMKLLDDLESCTVQKALIKHVHPGSTAITDGGNAFNYLIADFEDHKVFVVPPKESSKVLPWVHRAISNAKRKLLDIHHCVSKEYLQRYLDEFCYKTNRRYFLDNTFERLLTISASGMYKPMVLG